MRPFVNYFAYGSVAQPGQSTGLLKFVACDDRFSVSSEKKKSRCRGFKSPRGHVFLGLKVYFGGYNCLSNMDLCIFMDKRFADYIKRQNKLSGEGILLRKKVRGGKDSLGSKLGDFVLVHHGFDSKSLERYENLQEQLRGARGQDVLIFHSVRAPWNAMVVCGETPVIDRNTRYEVNLDLYFGKLSGKGLDFNVGEREIIFPTGRSHISISSKYLDLVDVDLRNAEVKLCRGRPRVKVSALSHLDTNRDYCSSFIASHTHGFSSKSGILVGSEVEEYFKGAGSGEKVYEGARELLKGKKN